MYTVVAQRQLSMSLESVWESLTRPEKLAKWFADTEHFAAGEPVRFDFGDGDYFLGTVVEWEPEIILGVRWKFVGHGPEYDVRFSFLRRKQGTELTVQDRGAITVEEAECLRVGWSEFLMRFEKSLLKDVSTRFNWRKAITFTVCVDKDNYDALRAALNDPEWYRQSLAGTHAVAHEARENEIAVGITHDAWGDVETRARIKFKRIRGVDYVLVAHEGWPELPGAIAEHERKRFVDVWLNALSQFSVT
jgi:uncharacterized protein YndB with AHSA1/START domain